MRPTLEILIIGTLLLSACSGSKPDSGSENDEQDKLPNIVIIYADDMGYGDLNCQNPNSKIPALYDKDADIKIFESGSILVYLAEKFGKFLPTEPAKRTEVFNWLFWQMGSAPYLGGGFGHFYAYAPEKFKYPIDRFAMETKRQLDVLDKQLAKSQFIAGDEYSIADMAIFPWYGALVKGKIYDAAEFLSVHEYKNVIRWSDELLKRPAILRGRLVNRTWGDEDQQLKERHSSNDFEGLKLDY